MLTALSLSKYYIGQPILRSVSFDVVEGSFFTLLGESGTGKTTLLKIIAGLEMADAGTMKLAGQDITRLSARQRNIPMIFQQPLLFPHLNIYQNIIFGLEMRRWPEEKIKKKAAALLEQLQITELANRMPATLSGGQQQRVAIARALAPGSPLVLMDEPFSSLDPALRYEMGQLVKNLQQEMKLTVIFVTHDVSEAIQLSDFILLMKDGQVLQTGTPVQLYETPESIDAAEFMGSGNLVSGYVHDGYYHSPLGNFQVAEMKKGPATGVVSEHRIALDLQATDWTVKEIRYLGRAKRYHLHNGKLTLWVEDTSGNQLAVGQRVGLRLPQKIHVII